MEHLNIKVEELGQDSDKNNLHHYTVSGLQNYWLSSELYKIEEFNGEEVMSFIDLDNVQAAIGMHICSLERPLGPREVKFIRSEMCLSQPEMGAILGYRDKQTILKAERRGDNREALTPTADLLMRRVYLEMLGKHLLLGENYRDAALKLSKALLQPIHDASEIDYRIAA